MPGGRPPLPTAEKKRRGTYRPDRARNEPRPPLITPDCPRWLSQVGQREWRRVAPMLERSELLSEIDGTALALYCDAYARWRKARDILAKKGLTFETNSGYVAQRPEVAIVNTAMQQIRQACTEFGMTPSSRGRMRLPSKTPVEEEQEMDDFLDAGRAQRRDRPKVVSIRGHGSRKTSK